MVDVIKRSFCKQVNRIIMVCSNYHSQSTFDPIRSLIKDEDVYTRVHSKTFDVIMQKILLGLRRNKELGIPPQKILIVVDDVAGLSAVQGRGTGSFANLSIQTTHLDVSMFVIVQQPKRADVNFRDNAENFWVFQDRGMASYNWLKEAYTALDMNVQSVKEMVLLAWRGGFEDDRERGQHFLFIHHAHRGPTKFFIDFDKEITIHKQ